MGLILESKCKWCRKLNSKLFLKGDRCFTGKCALEKRGRVTSFRSRRRMSQYARQLREKQRLRIKYGVVEDQFRKYYDKAGKVPGLTGEELLRLLERRLDNVIWRVGFASSRIQARQLITHGHFLVNGRKTKTPSYLVEEGDTIEVKEKSKKMDFFKQNVKDSKKEIPAWLEANPNSLKAQVLRFPEKEELDQEVDTSLIVGYYARR